VVLVPEDREEEVEEGLKRVVWVKMGLLILVAAAVQDVEMEVAGLW
jgi:hypothetical protein